MKHLIPAGLLTPAFLLFFPATAPGQDGAALFKSKCVTCHTATGAGKPAIKGSNLLTAEAKARSDAELGEAIAKGGTKKRAAHAYEKKGLTTEQVNTLVTHVRELQKAK
jgi:mono/diheme cytochrome c family protein